MNLSLCNEVLGHLPLAQQCEMAAAMGYHGLEIAPFTLAEAPEQISSEEAARIRRTVESFGLRITGLHWLLVRPEGLSLTAADAALRARSLQVMKRLTALCAELGGAVLVHGSPKQRQVAPGETLAAAHARLAEALSQVAVTAGEHGVIYCIEPLARSETQLINTVDEAAALVRAIGHDHLRTMIDCSAAGQTESEPVAALIDRWLPTGLIAHVQVNDPNRRAPGQGDMKFAPILAALRRQRYKGVIAVEPFDYVPDGAGAAAFAAGYLRGVLQTLSEATP